MVNERVLPRPKTDPLSHAVYPVLSRTILKNLQVIGFKEALIITKVLRQTDSQPVDLLYCGLMGSQVFSGCFVTW
jgi:hypothetical protein